MALPLRLLLLCLLSAMICGCAHETLVALVPDPDGTTGVASVETAAGSVTMNRPYLAAEAAGPAEAPTAPKEIDKKTVDKIFGEALSIQPKQPLHFLLYFKRGTTLTPVSLQTLANVLTAIRERDSGYVTVIGHADTMGTGGYNVLVSRWRALRVKDLLVREGVDPGVIWTLAYGEENLLVPTADEVWELRNRGTEVVVR